MNRNLGWYNQIDPSPYDSGSKIFLGETDSILARGQELRIPTLASAG
ncbi:MAG TPA: hypothetical protein PLH22_02420 [Candidatus Colwellbacteria bacterium]|nr:hypothetical protein [Candidatus Colwellbacteria bacterium]